MSYTNPTIEEVDSRRSALAPFDKINEGAFLALFATLISWRGVPATYLDLGSGTGAMVNMARKIGIDAYGIDVIARGPGREDWFITHDLTKPIQLVRTEDELLYAVTAARIAHDTNAWPAKFDLITCLEVAEHLPATAEQILVDTISRHLKTGGVLVFSAALPGQHGEHHVNLQTPWYWRDLFYESGVSYRQDYTQQLSHLWAWTSGPAMWLWSNLQCFDS